MDQRALPAVGAGVAGLLFGLTAALLPSSSLAVLAGVCSLLTAMAAYGLTKRLADTEREASTAVELMMARELATAENPGESGVIDPETRLPTNRFFELAVKARVASARRHLWPVSLVLLELTLNKDELQDEEQKIDALATFTRLMRMTLREADIACRIGPNTFGLILEDTPEEGGIWTAERLQITLAKEVVAVRQLAAGVATYPTHALRAEEMIKRAHTALARACATEPNDGLGQVEVAHIDLS